MIPSHYVPKQLTKKDRAKQKKAIQKTRKLYKKGKYMKRPHMKSFKNKPSPHVEKAKKMYNIKSLKPSRKLARITKCSLKALKEITKKGRGAYYSSGSRPNQSAQSWARARLASALTGGNASYVDRSVLEQGCASDSLALKLAKTKIKKGG